MSLKIHVILSHYEDYFNITGTNFKDTNEEFTETMHSKVRKSEECHGLKVVKKLGTPVHEKKSFRSVAMINTLGLFVLGF